MSDIKLSEVKKFRKYQLAKIAGYIVEEFDKESKSERCFIVGADAYIDNDFRNIDEVLKYISSELKSKGFNIAA